jgi:hypothetical protein
MKTRQTHKASELVRQFYEDSEKNGHIRLLQGRPPFVYYNHLKDFIMRARGSDHHTIQAYRDQLKSLKFIEIDELDRVFFIFKDSPYYDSAPNGALTKFLE